MSIKLNGVEITSNRLNGSSVSEEKLNGTVVYPGTTTKKWVLIGIHTSQSFYSPFYIISTGEQATAELMEQKFPASNYSVGHLGETQWYENFYVFQVQEV